MKKIKLKKCAKILLIILLVAVLTLSIVTAISTFIEYNTDFDGMPYSFLTVKGGSMSPEFSQGDLLIVRNLNYESLSVGDDVTFLTTNGLVTHRIVDIKDGEYITQGLANNTEDLYAVSKEAYCGKVVANIPYIGYALQFITGSYLVLAAAMLLLLAVCFARPIMNKIREKTDGNKEKASSSLCVRLLACLSALSLFLCLPYVTQTKYVGEINRFETLVAQPLYFSSNYLSLKTETTSGNTYNIQGWNGEATSLGLEIRNFSNELLFNGENRDISYGLGINKHSSVTVGEGANAVTTSYSTAYKVEITPHEPAAIPETAEDASEETSSQTPTTNVPTAFNGSFTFPSDWKEGEVTDSIQKLSAYTMAGGAKKTDKFNITVTPTGTFSENDKISFDIYAVTEQDKTYSIQLQGTFTFQVSKRTDFLGEIELVNQTSMLNLTVRTYPSNDGSNEKVVLFKWDPNKLYLNEYHSSVFSLINDPQYSNYYVKTDGRLYMKLQPYSMVTLEFFKIAAGDIQAGEVTAHVVDNVGDLPPTTPPSGS